MGSDHGVQERRCDKSFSDNMTGKRGDDKVESDHVIQ
jgi:hypothetical protein